MSYCITPGISIDISIDVGIHTMFKYYVKVLKTSYFPNHMMDLVYIWYEDKYRSKDLFSNVPNHSYDLKVKVMD